MATSQITLNGEPQILKKSTISLKNLVSSLSLQTSVAIAVNGEIVPGSQWGNYLIGNGDQVEIVQAVGGG